MGSWPKGILLIIFEVILFSYILIVGTGIKWFFWTDMGMVVGLILLIVSWLITRRIKTPANYWWYLIFLAALSTNVLQVGDIFNSPKYMSIYVSMGLVWLASYNVSLEKTARNLAKDVEKFIVGAGLIFALLSYWLKNYVEFVPIGMMQFGMVASYTATHHHLAIWWGMSVLVIMKWFSEDKWDKRVLRLLSFITIVVLVVSRTRSAIVGLLVGWGFTAVRNKKIKVSQLVVTLALGLLLVFLLGWNKSWTAIFVYSWQGMVAWIKRPGGYGIGNYLSVSTDFFPFWGGNKYQTAYAHNVIVEMLVGIGYWGLTYVWWIIRVMVQLVRAKMGEALYASMFILLITTMMVDVSYVIPSLVIMMGLSLGLVQAEIRAGEISKFAK